MNYQKNEKSFSDIVLGQIEKILELSRSELKDKSKFSVQQNHATFVAEEDSRKSYIQSVENLGYILRPYFDEEINKFYNKIAHLFIDYNYEIVEQEEEQYLIFKENIGDRANEKEFCIKLKLQASKKLFIELNKLLKRQDYLSSSIYGDVSSSEVEE